MQRAARDADVLILQAGHHFPASMDSTGVIGQPGLDRVRGAFFSRSLNHTLSALTKARLAWGFPPSSTIIMGGTVPVPHCSRFSKPLESLGGWLGVDSELRPPVRYEARWSEMHRLGRLSE